MIFFDQFKVPIIKFGKCFAEVMIPIALLKKFGSYEFVTIIEVSNMRRCSGKANKLRYIYTIRWTLRDIAIKERKIKRNLGLYMEYMYNVYSFNTASYEL